MKHQYSYLLLRYVHDILAGEQLNVGVVVYAPSASYVGALCRPTYARLARAFPGLRGDAFKATTRYIQSTLEGLGERLGQPSGERHNLGKGIRSIASQVLPRDDSSFQWSAPGFGVSSNLEETLDELYERFVTRCDDREQQERRTDEDVWRRFKRDLESRHLLQHLHPKTISVKDDEIEFRHAWKNGTWHCLQPVSFDLVRTDSIRDKAHKVLGELTSVRDAQEPLKVYLLVGKPQLDGMNDAFEKALGILEKAPTPTEIVTEERVTQFLDKFEDLVARHLD
jgi:hypothetical protein